jgi:hypothetical protein
MSGISKVVVAGALAAMVSVPALAEKLTGHGKVIVTVTNKADKGAPITVPEKDLTVKVDGKTAMISHWEAATNPLQVVLLIDNSSWSSLGTQMNDIKDFIRSLPAEAEVGVAYMQNGQAVFSSPLTKDKEAAVRGLHLPSGTPGGSASPYFCLSDLAKHWPSKDMDARREVIMITNGVDNYHPRFDPEDPYVKSAVRDSLKAGLVVYSIYWHSMGVPGGAYFSSTGQSLLLQVSDATGGVAYWQGLSNPVSFRPYFKEMKQRFGEQYNLEFSAPMYGKKAYVANLKVKARTEGAKITAPDRVWFTPPGADEAQ